jgi:serine protease Do
VNGVAAPAGGDTIVAADGRRISTSAQLVDLVALHKPGHGLRLEAVRDGATRRVEVTLGTVPDQP